MSRYLILALAAVSLAGCMSTPAGLHVSYSDSGCTSDGVCPFTTGNGATFYEARLREIVVNSNLSATLQAFAIEHETCHAHQHETVLEELGVEPSADLHEWYATSEARDYAAAIVDAPRPSSWTLSANTELEDFAEACGRYFTESGTYTGEPTRDAYFAGRGF